MKAVAKEQMVTREVLSASQRRAAIKKSTWSGVQAVFANPI